ncbi:unnamed protein product [Notodromas monacha]|uniref:Uncharacterized protein n=1 Tax=Notodromas monacha TaxID=399045 RepID=A0A7R9BZ05_9CRUS|nr:unnamed protein product [Notodromas monacha]CAG0922923.1 unnamed protein product [Notodromas monacha]
MRVSAYSVKPFMGLFILLTCENVHRVSSSSALTCYVCKPPFSGDSTSKNAANDVRNTQYGMFLDQSSIQTCDTFSPTGAAFQKSCKTEEPDKVVVCNTITNGIWVARSCETIFADDAPKCSLKSGVRSCQCDVYLCNQNSSVSHKVLPLLIIFSIIVSLASMLL